MTGVSGRVIRRHVFLALLVLIPGTPYVLAQREAARNLAERRAALLAPVPQTINRLPAGAALPLAQVAPPSPSGAEPPYPLNLTFDAESLPVGEPPTNHSFEESGFPTGSPPDNHDLSQAPSDVGIPSENHDFGTGDFTAWTIEGAPTIQSDAERGPWAQLGSSGQAVTTAPFTVDPDAQAIVFEFGSVSSGTDRVDVSILSGPDFSNVTVIGRWGCSGCDGWVTAAFGAAPYRGQIVKLRLARYSGVVGIDAVRQQVVFPGYEMTGWVRLADVVGNPYARLDSGSLVSPAFLVVGDAQFLTYRVRGLTTSADQYYTYVLSGPDFATSTQVASGSAADAWTAIRVNVGAWQGETIKLRFVHQNNAVGVDDLGLQTVDILAWDITKNTFVLADGPTGAYASTDGALTSQPVVLATDAQRMTVRVKKGPSIFAASSYFVELLRGPTFATVTQLTYDVIQDDAWHTPVLGVAQYAGETVKIRVRAYLGQTLVDEVGLTESLYEKPRGG
jgi:hypothetical protein